MSDRPNPKWRAYKWKAYEPNFSGSDHARPAASRQRESQGSDQGKRGRGGRGSGLPLTKGSEKQRSGQGEATVDHAQRNGAVTARQQRPSIAQTGEKQRPGQGEPLKSMRNSAVGATGEASNVEIFGNDTQTRLNLCLDLTTAPFS